MEIRQATSPQEARHLTTEELRERFLIENLFQAGQVTMVYSHYDRMVIGGAFPTSEALEIADPDTLKTDYFLERREVGFIHVGGGAAVIEADGERYELAKLDALYVGKGTQSVRVSSADSANPAKLYFCSTLAHAVYPTVKIALENATPNHLGTMQACNERTLYQYIHAGAVQSCQLMLGVTVLKEGSIWNTMPAHLHDRRMEAYLYFDLHQDARVFHLMGQPSETRHLVVANEQAVISPNWSIHSGAGTSNYAFVWSMAGENYTFKDMDIVAMSDLK
ncbi:5-dehydro-4-deoxy-D-glucuronate isomerase [Paenibacillus sp. MMS18-CY102]|uniref:5-dehydro-4-deoxy-D-glucuronate isomerase n=1 Tax=Paenibacillus sp. MMS18-CY102 TaxID=2682849 RepID=UPI00136527E1|nr:5-dehydro-4-deoxy-D-glucuronate isomerase [Paenibacillus sp. MMS18-CY102]MWC27887.1 5-dehydro-4-deoxy-D-glucuronate isomerase [Paenibacillus sp. MMS18-CY102]